MLTPGVNTLERDVEVSLSLDPANRPGNYEWFTIAGSDVPRIQIAAPSSASQYASIWWNTPSGLGMQMLISGAGAITYSTVGPNQSPTTGRNADVIETRLSNPITRTNAIASLVLRGPNNTFAEFGCTNPGQVPYMQLCDSTGKGWKFSVLADGTGFAPASAVSTAMQAQMINDPAWLGADGRTVLGSERPGSLLGSVRARSEYGRIEINWSAGKTYIRMKQNAGASHYDVAPDNTGALVATVVP